LKGSEWKVKVDTSVNHLPLGGVEGQSQRPDGIVRVTDVIEADGISFIGGDSNHVQEFGEAEAGDAGLVCGVLQGSSTCGKVSCYFVF
jgi:hypothetical protein